jgi:hypothetical protein
MLRVYQKFSGKNFHPPKITSTKPLDHSYSLPLIFKTPLKQLPIPINLIHPELSNEAYGRLENIYKIV